jgi:hypothetical protein
MYIRVIVICVHCPFLVVQAAMRTGVLGSLFGSDFDDIVEEVLILLWQMIVFCGQWLFWLIHNVCRWAHKINWEFCVVLVQLVDVGERNSRPEAKSRDRDKQHTFAGSFEEFILRKSIHYPLCWCWNSGKNSNCRQNNNAKMDWVEI